MPHRGGWQGLRTSIARPTWTSTVASRDMARRSSSKTAPRSWMAVMLPGWPTADAWAHRVALTSKAMMVRPYGGTTLGEEVPDAEGAAGL
jgi:hypothetical protein